MGIVPLFNPNDNKKNKQKIKTKDNQRHRTNNDKTQIKTIVKQRKTRHNNK